MPLKVCLCELVAGISSRHCFRLLTHDQEHGKSTNTGKLIRAMLPKTRVFNWSRVATDENFLWLLDNSVYQGVLVFPENYAVPGQKCLSLENRAEKKTDPLAFIILDATWQQARKMYRQSPYLHNLPMLSLVPEAPSIYSLRRNSHSQHLCTAEVAAHALSVVGETRLSDMLNAIVQVYCDQYLCIKNGRKSPDESPALKMLQGLKSIKS